MVIQMDANPRKAIATANISNKNSPGNLTPDAVPACPDEVGALVKLLVVTVAVDEVALPVAKEGASDVLICESSTSMART